MKRSMSCAVAITGISALFVLTACGDDGEDTASYESTDEIVEQLVDSDYPCEEGGADEFFSSGGGDGCSIDGEDHPMYITESEQSGEEAIKEQSLAEDQGNAVVGSNWFFDCGSEENFMMDSDECGEVADILDGVVVSYGSSSDDE